MSADATSAEPLSSPAHPVAPSATTTGSTNHRIVAEAFAASSYNSGTPGGDSGWPSTMGPRKGTIMHEKSAAATMWSSSSTT